MAGKLVQVATNTVTSAVASVSLTGIDDNSVYMLTITDVDNSNAGGVGGRVIKASDSSVDSTSNYDSAWKGMRTIASSFSNISYTNQTFFANLAWSQNTADEDTAQGVYHLYNFFDSSEYSFMIFDSATFGFPNPTNKELLSTSGGGVHTVGQSNSGINLFPTVSGNFVKGTFSLYKVV